MISINQFHIYLRTGSYHEKLSSCLTLPTSAIRLASRMLRSLVGYLWIILSIVSKNLKFWEAIVTVLKEIH